MVYYSLREAAAEINRRAGAPLATAESLLREGAFGRLLICVPLETTAYSPTARLKRRATVDIFGLFVVPPRHLFTLQMNESTRLKLVTSLDGKVIYFLNEPIRRDQLCIHADHLPASARAIPVVRGTASAPAAPEAAERRADHLAIELDELLRKLPSDADRSPRAVMQALATRVGTSDSCIVAAGVDVVTWQNQHGGRALLRIDALRKRLGRAGR